MPMKKQLLSSAFLLVAVVVCAQPSEARGGGGGGGLYHGAGGWPVGTSTNSQIGATYYGGGGYRYNHPYRNWYGWNAGLVGGVGDYDGWDDYANPPAPPPAPDAPLPPDPQPAPMQGPAMSFKSEFPSTPSSQSYFQGWDQTMGNGSSVSTDATVGGSPSKATTDSLVSKVASAKSMFDSYKRNGKLGTFDEELLGQQLDNLSKQAQQLTKEPNSAEKANEAMTLSNSVNVFMDNLSRYQ